MLKIKGFSEIKVDKVKDALAKCQVCEVAVIKSDEFADVLAAFRRWLPDCS